MGPMKAMDNATKGQELNTLGRHCRGERARARAVMVLDPSTVYSDKPSCLIPHLLLYVHISVNLSRFNTDASTHPENKNTGASPFPLSYQPHRGWHRLHQKNM